MKSISKQETLQNDKAKLRQQSLTERQIPQNSNRSQILHEANSQIENNSLLQQKGYQNWLRKRYRVRANINYLWHAHQLYDKQQLDELFQTVIDNSPQIYKLDINQDSSNGQDQEINLEAFYHVMKNLGKENFMDRDAFNKIIHLIDRDGNRKLNKNEFYTMLMSRTINQYFQQLNQESWKKQQLKNKLQNISLKRNRFASVDQNNNSMLSQKSQFKQNKKPEQPLCLPSLISPKNQMQSGFDTKYKSSCTTPINLRHLNIPSPFLLETDNMNTNKRQFNSDNKNKFNSDNNGKYHGDNNGKYHGDNNGKQNYDNNNNNNNNNNNKEINNFSQIDLTKMIGQLKFENDRSKLIKDFSEIRNDRSIDIGEKCDKLNQILKQKHFNVDNIGISPTQKLLSKAKISNIRNKSHTPPKKGQSQIDIFEGSIFLSEVNIGGGGGGGRSVCQSTDFLPSINMNKDKSNPHTIENSTNIGSNFDESSLNDKYSLSLLQNKNVGKRFEFVKHFSEINLDEGEITKIQDPLDMIDGKLYNSNHHHLSQKKKQSNSYMNRKNSHKDAINAGLNTNSQLYQSMDLQDEIDYQHLYQQQSIQVDSQLNIIEKDDEEDDDNDEECLQQNKRELGMIVERAKYKGRKQAECLTTEKLDDQDSTLFKRIATNISKVREISNTNEIYSQYPRNIRRTFKQKSFSIPKRQNEIINTQIAGQNRLSNSRKINQFQTCFKNNVLQAQDKQNRIISNDSSFLFVKI